MRTAIYIRVSTEEQAKEGYSIPAQREKLLAYALSQDWSVVDTYIDDGRSGKDLARPQLQRLRTDIATRKIDVVLVYRLDRLTRSVLDLYHLLQEFEIHQVKFRSATEVYDTTTAIGRLFITLVAALAQWERENLGERTRLGKEEKIRQGKRAGGIIPYGYLGNNDTLAIYEQEAVNVRLMFQLYRQFRNLNRVADSLFQLGIRTRKEKPFSVKTIRDLLRNPVYIGSLRYNHTNQSQSKRGVNPPESWILVENCHPPIVADDEFYLVQDIMNKQSGKRPRTLSSSYLFSGCIRCPHCNQTLFGKSSKSYRYYHCSYTNPKACHQFSIREDQVEPQFVQYLQDRWTSQFSVQLISDSPSTPAQFAMTQAELYHKELHQLAQKEQRLQQLFLAQMIEFPALQEQVAVVKKRKTELDQLLSDVQEPISLSEYEILSVLLDIQTTWLHMTTEEKRQVIQLLVDHIQLRLCEKLGTWRIDSVIYQQ